MSPRTKSILLLLLALVIGGVLGALLNARLAERRIVRLASFRSEQGFMRYMEQAVEPVDDVQRERIRAVLQSSAERMSRHREASWREARLILDSTRAELRTILTEDQMLRLEEHLENQRFRFGRRSDRRPPGERGGRMMHDRNDTPPRNDGGRPPGR